jgi:hypothetical protein
MTSLLAFVWRRKANALSPKPSSNNQNNTGRDEPPASPVPPVITSSTSSSSDTLQDEHENVAYWKVPTLHAPCTPEGLRPRPSATTLRHELDLPAQQQAQEPSMPWFSRDLLSQPRAVLPPRPMPSSSWSLQGTFSSPPVSTNSFYARNHGDYEHDGIAESPQLQPGRARTAVGALVALQQQQQQQQPPQWLGSSYYPGLPLQQQQQQQEPSYTQSPNVLPKRSYDWDAEDQREDECGEEVPYYSLDPVENARTPLRVLQHQHQQHQHERLNNQSPISNSSSPVASPSSFSRPVVSYNNTKQDVNTSFSSRAGLIQSGVLRNQPTRYDFDPIVVPDGDRVAGTEVVLPHQADHLTNMSAMSQSLADQESLYGNSRTVSADEVDDMVRYDPALASGDLLQNQNARNQRRVKEELLIAILERLQDDVQLVADVQAVFSGCNEPPVDKQDGLLTGFPSDTRMLIVRNLNAILTEMDSVPSEEYFMSPSQVPVYAETHDDLREALFFCRTAVQMAVPISERNQGLDKISVEQQGRWQFLDGLRCAIGIIPPESPETVRGGDTSVFSLPSDSGQETPMTSNVSLTTTITSAVTTNFNDRTRHQTSAPNGLQLRRTIEILSTILHKMAVACLGLSEREINGQAWNLGAQASIRLTEDIKRNYLQLLAVKKEDVKALVDAFELYLPALAITREVSCDLEDDYQPQASSQGQRQAMLPPPPVLMRFAPGAAWDLSRSELTEEHRVVPLPCNAQRMNRTPLYRGSGDIFSPSTDDMQTRNSIEADDDEDEGTYIDECDYDDLRRTVGSNDYCDDEELRDGPVGNERDGPDEREGDDTRNAENNFSKKLASNYIVL